jgi:hypothetical protein
VGRGVAMAAFGARAWWLERQQVGRLRTILGGAAKSSVSANRNAVQVR